MIEVGQDVHNVLVRDCRSGVFIEYQTRPAVQACQSAITSSLININRRTHHSPVSCLLAI